MFVATYTSYVYLNDCSEQKYNGKPDRHNRMSLPEVLYCKHEDHVTGNDHQHQYAGCLGTRI